MNLLSQTASRAEAVTPHDSTEFTNDAAALYVGGTGDISILMPSGDSITFQDVPVGFFPVNVRRVNATGTTATNIIALR